jgi:membrane protein implicated in regulation of membrane protease activity
MNSNPRMLVIFTGATALAVGLIAALFTENWVFLPLALAVHAIGTLLVMQAVARRVTDDPEPDPIVKERLEEEQRTI